MGITRSIASRTNGNILRGPVWKTSGSSSTMRYWLKLNSGPPGIDMKVLMVNPSRDFEHIGAGLRVGNHEVPFNGARMCNGSERIPADLRARSPCPGGLSPGVCVTRCSGDTLDTYVERPYSPTPSGE